MAGYLNEVTMVNKSWGNVQFKSQLATDSPISKQLIRAEMLSE